MKASVFFNLFGLAALGSCKLSSRDYNANDYYVLHLARDTQPSHVALKLGLVHEGTLGELRDHHIFSSGKSEDDVVKTEIKARRRKRRELNDRDVLDGVLFSSKQVLRKPWEKRVPPAPRAGPVQRAKEPAVDWVEQRREAHAGEGDRPAWTVRWLVRR